jgi:hypothetical protein
MLLSGTRSSLLLTLFFAAILGIFQIRYLLFSLKNIIYLLFISVPLIIYASVIEKSLQLDTLISRWDDLNRKIDVVTGEGINRQGTYQLAYRRIREENLTFGNGYCFGQAYSKVVKGQNISEYKDFHNLYLSLPFFYGWAGAFLLILMFVIPLFILFKRKRLLWVSFFSMWVVFLINEYKIQFIRDPHYTMLIWILLGITYCFINNPVHKQVNS